MSKKRILSITAVSALVLGVLLGLNPSMAMEKEKSPREEKKNSPKPLVEEDLFSLLPPEMVVHIAHYLFIKDFKALGSVCTIFHQISQDPIFYLPKESENLLELLKKFTPPNSQKTNLHPLALFISRTLQADEQFYQTGMKILTRKKIFKPGTVEIDPSGDLKAKIKAAKPGFFSLVLAEMLFHRKATANRLEILEKNKLLLQTQNGIPFSHHFFPVAILPVLGPVSLNALIERQDLESLFLRFKQIFAQTESCKAFYRRDYQKVQDIQIMYDSKKYYLFQGYLFQDPLNTQKNITKLLDLFSSFSNLPEQNKIFNDCEKQLQNLEDYLENLHQKVGRGPFGTPGTLQEIAVLLSTKKALSDLQKKLAKSYHLATKLPYDKAQKVKWYAKAGFFYGAAGSKEAAARAYYKAAKSGTKDQQVGWYSQAAFFFEAAENKELAARSYYKAAKSDVKEKQAGWYAKAGFFYKAVGNKKAAARSFADYYFVTALNCEDQKKQAGWYAKAGAFYEDAESKKAAARSYYKAAQKSDVKEQKIGWHAKAAFLYKITGCKEAAARSYYKAAQKSDVKEQKVEWFTQAASLYESLELQQKTARAYFNAGYFSDDKLAKEKIIGYVGSFSKEKKRYFFHWIRECMRKIEQERKQEVQAFTKFLEIFESGI